jgi:hypothetical protein
MNPSKVDIDYVARLLFDNIIILTLHSISNPNDARSMAKLFGNISESKGRGI